nr:hypothetical protein CFP56_21017 [Quercus suber]
MVVAVKDIPRSHPVTSHGSLRQSIRPIRKLLPLEGKERKVLAIDHGRFCEVGSREGDIHALTLPLYIRIASASVFQSLNVRSSTRGSSQPISSKDGDA